MSQGSNNVRYERRDINARALVLIAIGACVCAVLGHLALGRLFHIYRAEEDHNDTQPSALSTFISQEPPSPRLQAVPIADLNTLQQEQQARLNSYGWVDAKSETVRIPIDRAINLIVKSGLPTWETKVPVIEKAPGSEVKP